MKKNLNITFLGTGSAEKLPREDDCPQCTSKNKKDKRLRSSILINDQILVDASPDVSLQLNEYQIRNLNAILITHEHSDHVGGLKDILHLDKNAKIIKLKAGQHFKLSDIDFHAFRVRHSNLIPTVGIEIGDAIYMSDYADLDWARQYIKSAKTAILDGSVLGRDFGGHLSINESIALTKQLENLKSIYFTHNGHTHKTHDEMEALVQSMGDDRYNLAYDGLQLKI